MSDCQCGRPWGVKPHCPRCGSSYMYATRNQDRYVEKKDGTKAVIRAFFCRNCAMPFDESMPCEAPLTKAAQRLKEFYSQTGDSDQMAAKQQEIAFGLFQRNTLQYQNGKMKSITPQQEEFLLKRTGMSFHELTGCPIVDDGPITESTPIDPTKPDEQAVGVAALLPEDYHRLDPSHPLHAELKAEYEASKHSGEPNEDGT